MRSYEKRKASKKKNRKDLAVLAKAYERGCEGYIVPGSGKVKVRMTGFSVCQHLSLSA